MTKAEKLKAIKAGKGTGKKNPCKKKAKARVQKKKSFWDKFFRDLE